MYFPRYWAKGEVTGPTREGMTYRIEAWGWSDTSYDDAKARAEERARASLDQATRDERGWERYYQVRPFREPVLEDISSGGLKALITRNTSGCEILNTDRVGFADIDYWPHRRSLFEALFDFNGKKKKALRQEWEAKTLEEIREWQGKHRGWTFRVYRTAGGMRLLLVSKLQVPESEEAQDWLTHIGCDGHYVILCRTQKSFRARLTPKPFRCKIRPPSVRFPWTTPKAQATIEKWLKDYAIACERFSTCDYVETIGGDQPLAQLRPIIEVHDRRSGVGLGLPLA
jgi:hypothetical protein